MSQGSAAARWAPRHVALHWAIAALVLAQLPIGFFFLGHKPGETPPLLSLHVSFGLLIGLLMVTRTASRLAGPVPELPATLPPWQRLLARVSHTALYVLLIVQVIVGYFLEDTFGAAVRFFGLELPSLVGETKGLPKIFGTIHTTIGYAIAASVALHVAGALHHHFRLRDDVLRRMLPLRRSDRR